MRRDRWVVRFRIGEVWFVKHYASETEAYCGASMLRDEGFEVVDPPRLETVGVAA
jgi:hypothetical protein